MGASGSDDIFGPLSPLSPPSPPPPPPPPPGVTPPGAGEDWLRTELERLQDQIRGLATALSHQQSVFVDIAGARTAELHRSLAQVEEMATGLRTETERMRQLQDAISHHLHDLVLDVVQPELRAQLGQGIPQLVVEAMAPELRRALADWLPQIVATNISPEVRQLLSEWLPVMVADTVQPEVRQAIAERLPDVTAAAVQPEVRRILAERLPHLVAETVQPEIYRVLVERLPAIVGEAVTPDLREVMSADLPHLVSEAVRPEVRDTLDQRLPGLVGQVVNPEVRRVLAERLPHLVAETVQPELRQILADRLPHLVSETVRPEIRETLDERLPGVVAQVVSPEVRRTLAERLPHLVAETVQPELRQILSVRLPAIVAEAVTPAVGALFVERVPAMLAETVSPELSVTLAETEGAAAELRHEAAKLRGLREVVAERLPEAVIGAIEPHLQDVLAVQFPRLVGEMVEPIVRSVLTDQMPALVAQAVRPAISQNLADRIPSLVAETVRPELRDIVARALEERLPGVVGEAVRPELRERLAEILPPVIAEVVSPEVMAMVGQRLPALLAETVTPELSVSLAEVEGTAAEMRAETARIRGLREVVAERLPEAVMGAVQGVLDQTITARLPDLLSDIIRPALGDAVAVPLPAALAQQLEPAVAAVIGRELPDLVRRSIEREVQLGLSESLPTLVADATEPGVRAALSQMEASIAEIATLRERLFDRLGELTREAAAAPLAHFETSSAQLRAQAERMGDLREDVLRKLPVLVEEAVSLPLAEFESSAAQLRVEAERLRALRGEIAGQLPKLVQDAVSTALARHGVPGAVTGAAGPAGEGSAAVDVEAVASQLRADALQLREIRSDLARDVPRIVQDAIAAAVAAAGEAASIAPPPPPAEPPAQAPPSPPAAPDAGTNPATEVVDAPLAPEPAPEAPAEAPTESAGAVEPPEAVPVADAPAPVDAPARPPADEEDIDPSLAAALAPPPANGSRVADVVAADDATTVACVLPGVVVGPTLARGISEAAGRARLRRRRRRRAGPPAAGLHRRDPFASELTRRLEWFALARRQGANGAAANGGSDPGVIAAGERDGNEVVLPLARNGGLSLIGPRAREVARALVLTFLADNAPDAARAIVVGDLLPATTTFPGLGRARDVSSVLGGLQAEASRRLALFAEAGVSDITAYRSVRPDDPLPTVLVAAAEMTTLEAGRLGSVLDDGPRAGITGVLVDAPLEGVVTLRLQGPGRVASVLPESAADDLVGARLFTVERDPAGELLEVLASARTDLEGEPSAQPADEPFEAVPASSAVINVKLLGAYRIDVNGREVRSGLRAKAKELLAFYLLHPEGTTLEDATEALWPEADPRRGSEWFWTALGNLRSRLRSATENPDLKVIEREGDRYRIEPLFEVDLWRFEHALAAAGSQSGDPAWAEALQHAADLYGGELLAGADWPWAEVPREDLRGRAVDVLVSLAATRLVAGDIPGALAALERAVEIDPLAEQLYRRIMRLHAKLSRPDQADAAFKALVARLGEFNLQPSPESEKLHEELCGTS